MKRKGGVRLIEFHSRPHHTHSHKGYGRLAISSHPYRGSVPREEERYHLFACFLFLIFLSSWCLFTLRV